MAQPPSRSPGDPPDARPPEEGPPRRRKRRWLGVLKLVVGVGLLAALLIWQDNGRKLIEVLKGFSPEYLLQLWLIAIATNAVSSVKWGLFLKDRGYHLHWWRLFELYLIGKFFSNFLPSMFGGDVARSYITGRQISSQSVSAASVFMERATGLVGLTIMALAGCAMNPSMLSNPIVALPVVAMVGATVVGVVMFLSPRGFPIGARIAARIPKLGGVARKLDKLAGDIGHYRGNRRLLWLSLLYSMGFHFIAILNVYISCLSIGLEPRFLDVMVVTPVILLLSMIPVSPNNIGWWEWCFSTLLVGAGATPAQGLAVALVIRAFDFLNSVIGGLLLLRRQPDPIGR